MNILLYAKFLYKLFNFCIQMKLIYLILTGLLLFYGCQNSKSLQIESSNFKIVKLSDGVWACIHKFGGKAICNVGVIDNGNETIIFDSFLSPEAAKELLAAIENSNLSPVKYVINSHYHNDHIRGNQVFGKDVKIVSTNRTRDLIEEFEPLNIQEEKEYAPGRFHYWDSLYVNFNGDKNSREFKNILMWRPYYETLSDSYKEVHTRLPDTMIDSLFNMDGPKRKVQLTSIGSGHTESDLVLYLPDDGILFSGDLIFNYSHPYLADGSVYGLFEWLDFLQTMDIQKIVPGHGEIGNKVLVNEMKDYLVTLDSMASELAANGAGEEDLSSVRIPVEFADWWFERFFYFNLNFVLNNKKQP